MTEHVHEWEIIFNPDHSFRRVVCKTINCFEEMSDAEHEARLNATERLSARRVHGILEDKKLYSQDVLALHEYADILEGKE